jgi:exodeoxyribonuclease VII small subunit
MTSAEGASDIRLMSFEDALSELEAIVRRLEEGSAKLDEAITAYERGALLKRHCENKLNEAQGRIEKIVLGADGSVTGAEPLAPTPPAPVARD